MYLSDSILPISASTTWRLYAIPLIPFVLFLTSVVFDFEFYFFLALIPTIVFVVGMINFEAAFLFVPLSLTNPYTLQETQSNLHISEVILLAIFCVWLIRLISTPSGFSFPQKFLVPTILIISMAVVSLSVANYLLPGVQQVIRYIEILVFLFLIVFNYCRTEHIIRQIFLVLLIGGLLQSLLGLGQFMTGEMTRSVTRRIFGWHGGGYGALIGSTLMFCCCILLYEKRVSFRIWALVIIPFSALALILSQTRAWIGAFTLALFLMFVVGKRKLMGRVLVIGCIVGFTFFLVVQTNGFGLVENNLLKSAINSAFRFETTPGKRSTEDLSLLMRLNTWKTAIGIFLSHPITGIGVGNLRFQDYFSLRLGNPSQGLGYVDNQYIQFFTEAGIVAGIAWILFMFFALQGGWRAVQLSKDSPLHSVAAGLFGSLLIMVIGSFFWVITPHHELFAIMIINIGLLLNISRLPRSN